MARDEEFPSRTFLLLWQADAVSGLGSYVTLLSLQVLVVRTLHGSTTEVGWLNASRFLPYLVVGVVVGALVDRRRRLPLMIGTDLVQAALLLTIPLLWWWDLLTFPALLVIVAAYGTVSVVSVSASMSFLPRVVEARFLQRAHARTDGTDAAASTAGPALGGLLVSTLGAPLAVVVDAATYLWSAAVLSRIRVVEPPAVTGATVRGLVHEVREGVRWVYRGSGLRNLALSTHGWFVGNAIVGVVLAPYTLTVLGLSAFQLGLVGAIGGVGALVGAAVTTRVGLWLGTGWTIIACHVVSTLGVVVMVLATRGLGEWGSIAVLGTGQALYGLAMGASNSHETSYRQIVTPDGLQARTNVTMRSINRAMMVVAAPVAGITADAVGVRPTLLVAAAIFALVSVGLAGTSFRSVRA